jgi:hypothetical protein
MTRVVNMRREDCDVVIARPSMWGNPFSHRTGTRARFLVMSREEAIAKYEDWIRQQPLMLAAIPQLAGKRLGCWCAPNACHGDILVKLVNELTKGNQP